MPRPHSSTRQLARLLDSTSLPIYALDETRRIIYLNSSCADWLGIEAGQLLGARCAYTSGEGNDQLANIATALCPPPEVFHGQRKTAWINCPTARGVSAWRRGEFVPVENDHQEFLGLIAVLGGLDEPNEPPQSPAADRSSDELHRCLRSLTSEFRGRFRPERLVGDSAIIRRVRQQVQLAIDGLSRVVVVGPVGSGREQVARTTHCGNNPDSASPLMPLSCSLLDAELLQTTVLAFLRRCQDSPTEQSASLLLLDVDQLSPDAQAELLAFFRVPTFALRTIVTAQRSLTELASEDRFLHDLALLLSVLVIELPSLAERRQDIPFIAQRMLEEYNERGERQFSGFAPDVLDQLGAMPWPGNLPELWAVVSGAIDNAAGPLIDTTDLPQRVHDIHAATAYPAPQQQTIVLDEFLGKVERELIERALHQARGNKAQAARLLGIHRARLLRRITQLGLDTGE